MQPRPAHVVWHPRRPDTPPPPALAAWLAGTHAAAGGPELALVDGSGGPIETPSPLSSPLSTAQGIAVVAEHPDEQALAIAARLGADDVVDLSEPPALWQRRLANLTSLAVLRRETRRRRDAARAYFGRPAPKAAPTAAPTRAPVLLVGVPDAHKVAAVDALTGWSVAAYAETSAHARCHLETSIYSAVIVTDIVTNDDLDRRLAPLAAVEGPGAPSLVVFRHRDAAFDADDAHHRGAVDVLDHDLAPDVLQRRLATAIEAAQLRRDLRDDAAFAGAADPISGRLSHSAFHVYVQDRLHEAVPGAAMLALTLDNLDDINREAGFAAGDRALAAVGHALSRGVRAEDAIGRLDGASFGIWLGDIGEQDLTETARRLQARVRRAWLGDGGPALVPRVGWMRPLPGEDALTLTRRARAEARRALLRIVG